MTFEKEIIRGLFLEKFAATFFQCAMKCCQDFPCCSTILQVLPCAHSEFSMFYKKLTLRACLLHVKSPGIFDQGSYSRREGRCHWQEQSMRKTSLQCIGKLFCCLSWNPGHENSVLVCGRLVRGIRDL